MNLLYLIGVRLRFTRESAFHFFHHPALYAAILDRLGNPKEFPWGAYLYTPERGRVRYLPGEPYTLGFALHPDSKLSPSALVDLLRTAPKTSFGRTQRAPFGDNFLVESATDLVAQAPLSWSPQPLTLRLLDPTVEELARREEITIRFLSPLRIHRPPFPNDDILMDGENFDPAKLLERVARALHEAWPDASFTRVFPVAPPAGWAFGASPYQTDAELLENRMHRTDVAYPKKRAIGSSGSVRLRFPGGVGRWALPLLLAGLVGVGRTPNMGLGRFMVENLDLPVAWPPAPAQTLLQRAANESNLRTAREEIRSAGESPGVDEVTKEEFLDGLTARLPALAGSIREGRLEVSPLKGVLVIESRPGVGSGNKVRPLAVPTFLDRFIQRAILEELNPAVDQLLEDSSYAYRKGLSHRSAQRGVDQARNDGFHFALDADIRSFFDNVDWDKLRLRLDAYFGSDPIVDLLMAYVKSPIEFEGRRIERTSGLPQGAGVSPMLANLYLDGLDEAVERAGFRLVRYADDFVVFGKSRKDLVRARQTVTSELTRLGLSLNEEKTRETSFDEGFRFLGALFCRSAVLTTDREGREVTEVLTKVPKNPELLRVASGWLKDFLSKRSLFPETSPAEPFPSPAPTEMGEALPRLPNPAPMRERRPVYVVSGDVKLVGKKRGLLVTHGKNQTTLVPWGQISELVVVGGHYISGSVYQRTLRYQIPVAFYHRDGSPMGLLLPEHTRNPSAATVAHWEWNRNEGRRLEAAKDLISAKIRNTRLSIRRRADAESLFDDLHLRVKEVSKAQNAEALRGIEGRAAHAYFSLWPKLLKKSLGSDFPGRVARGAEDPVNAMLNLLYTQLFRLTHLAILSTGLDPNLGLLHEGKGRYPALAADLMEPFRFLVDRVVFEAVNEGHIGPDGWRRCEKGPYRLLLTQPTVKVLLKMWEEILAGEVTDEENRHDTYKGHLCHQALSLSRWIEGKGDFKTFRMKW